MKHVTVKRISLWLFAIMLLAMTALAGCGNSGGGTSEEGTTGGEAPSSDTQGSETSGDETQGGETSGGDVIKVGYVAPFSGPMASFTVGARYTTELALETINKEGGVEIDGKKVPVEVVWGDSESDPTKASEVATKLATDDKVNILIGEWTPATTSPVSAVGERYKVPTIVANGPDTSWLEGGPYEWSFGLLFDYNKFIDEYFNGWDKMETNKKIGLVLDSNVDGVGMAEILTAKAAERGYTVIDPGRFPEGTKDYMQVLSQIQKEGCDILVASLLNPELVTVWSQCQQLNYIPKTAVLSKGMHFVTEVQALGEGKGEGLCIETQWSPQFPFASSLTGQTSAEQSAAYEEAVGASPDLTIGWDWSIWDVIADVLTRAGSLDPEKIRQAFIDTDLNCTYGHVVFAENHVGYVPIVFGQWVLDDKWGYKKNIIAAEWTPEITEISEPLYIPNYNSSK